MKIKSIKINPSRSELIFNSLQHLPWPCFLDSCQPYSETGRYDIISADPYIKLIYKKGVCRIFHRDKMEKVTGDPFILCKKYLHEQPSSDLPFTGGAIGFFSYDLCQYLEKLPSKANNDTQFNEMMVGIYDWAIIMDHQEKQVFYVENGNDPSPTITSETIEKLLQNSASQNKPFSLLESWASNMSYHQYCDNFKKIKKHILHGDCYQINLTQRFKNTYEGDLWIAYKQLREKNYAPYSAFLQFDDFTIMSCSPEQFLHVSDQKVTTKPMKGTSQRDVNPTIDKKLAEQLFYSEKNRAENLMIVDLMRNDLGRCCIPGSIKVPNLFAIESFPGVHQMVTTVNGVLDEDHKPIDLLRACFPGGSITGAPKIRAMEIIESLEPNKRSIYCGTIGYVSHNGNMDTNIAIRTLFADRKSIYLSVGGAIVADSGVKSEYDECYTKINKIFEVL